MYRHSRAWWAVALAVAAIALHAGCRKADDSAPGGSGAPAGGAAAGPMAKYAGEWRDQWHTLTVEPDGRGYGSADFGSYQSGEFQFREENGKASVTLPHPVGRQGTKTFPARFAGDDTIELLDDGGKMIYALKRQPPRPAAKLAELAGNWEGWDVAADGAAGAAGGHDLVLGLHRLAVTLDAAGRGKWQRTDGGTGEIALQERDGRFQFDGLEGKTWQVAPVRIGRDSTVLRFRTPDGTVRVYLRKLTTKGDAAGPAGGTGKAP